MAIVMSLFSCNKPYTSPSAKLADNDSSLQTRILQDTTSYTKSIDYFEESSEGGTITWHVHQGSLIKIEIVLFGATGNVTRVMKLNGNNLLEYKEVMRFYENSLNSPASAQVKDSTIVMVEFHNGLIKNINHAGKEIDSVRLEYVVQQIDVNKNKYLELFNKSVLKK